MQDRQGLRVGVGNTDSMPLSMGHLQQLSQLLPDLPLLGRVIKEYVPPGSGDQICIRNPLSDRGIGGSAVDEI